jgi:hypothetical protein
LTARRRGNPDPPNPPIKDPKVAPGLVASALPGWGNITPFTLLSASQFWLPGPPALTSPQYARDFNEVKSQAARESADSRIYAGIHFRSACEDGIALGRKIGHRAAASYLLPLRN